MREFSVERALADFDGVPFGDLGPDVPALGWIHIAKFPERLLAKLCDMGLAQQGRAMLPETPHRGAVMAEWIGLHPTLAGAYMTVVARRVGQEAGYNPLTDQADFRRATVNGNVAAALRLLGVSGDTEDAKEAPRLEGNGVHTYVSLALNYVRPGNLDDVSPEAIFGAAPTLRRNCKLFASTLLANSRSYRRSPGSLTTDRGWKPSQNTSRRPLRFHSRSSSEVWRCIGWSQRGRCCLRARLRLRRPWQRSRTTCLSPPRP
ncbi:hypothetical protein AB0J68_19085 [Micromonospora sp. NPDC049580]|uniref:hypothetical protein n=1 Tax=Micromonospora sp. NPDC049580 TaxID=3154832 RepID=UPI0034452C8B